MAFKRVIIWRVGPLSWLLEPKKQKTAKAYIYSVAARFFKKFLFSIKSSLSPTFAKLNSRWLLVQGFHELLSKLQFTLPIVKLRSTVFMANWQRGSSSFWHTKHQVFWLLTTQSSGTSVHTSDSNFTSGASAPYLGC